MKFECVRLETSPASDPAYSANKRLLDNSVRRRGMH